MHKASHILSRRDFLKFSGLGFVGFITKPNFSLSPKLENQQGRVIYDTINVFDIPSFSGNVTRQFWADSIIPISSATVGDEEPAYNRVWYRIGDAGYAHSGGIQPVKTIRQQPVADIREGGQLCEITVPYTDARWSAKSESTVAYRFYYETTHWVTGLTIDDQGKPWYRILDDKWELVFYANAEHIRLLPDSELSVISPHVPAKDKRIEVRTNEQVVVAYEWDRPVFMAKTATGAEFSNGRFYTPFGRHYTDHKRPSRHMAAGNLAYNGYDLPGVPWICYFTESGIAFHGTYWHNDYGRPRSHGCINLTSQAAKWIYRWTTPIVLPHEQRAYKLFGGTAVDVI